MDETTKPIILHIIDELPPDGAERLLADILFYRSSDYDYRVLCIIDEGPLKAEIVALGVPVDLLQRQSKYDLLFILRLRDYIKALAPHAVHTHLFTADSWGRVASYLAGIRNIFSTVHSTNDWMTKIHIITDQILAKITTQVIACSDGVNEKLTKEYKLNNVTLIPNGVAMHRFEQQAAANLQQQFNLTPEIPVFALIGRLHEAKGHEFIIPTLRRLKEDNMQFYCLFVGGGALKEKIKTLIADNGLDEQVILTGFRKDVPNILRAIDFLIMPSRWEGLPMTLLEAMASKKAAIASKVGGIPTVLADNAGILLSQDDVVGWHAAIKTLLSDKNKREELGENGYKKVISSYSAEAVQKQYEALYNNCPSENTSTSAS